MASLWLCVTQVQLSIEKGEVAWTGCGCGQWGVSGRGPVASVLLLRRITMAGSVSCTGRTHSGWRVCDRECCHGTSVLINQLLWLQVFFAVLLVGVSIGQALPHVLRLIAAERAANRLSVVIARVGGVCRRFV